MNLIICLLIKNCFFSGFLLLNIDNAISTISNSKSENIAYQRSPVMAIKDGASSEGEYLPWLFRKILRSWQSKFLGVSSVAFQDCSNSWLIQDRGWFGFKIFLSFLQFSFRIFAESSGRRGVLIVSVCRSKRESAG